MLNIHGKRFMHNLQIDHEYVEQTSMRYSLNVECSASEKP